MKPNLENKHQKRAVQILSGLADATKDLRAFSGDSQRSVSRKTSISQAFISRFENHIFQTKVIYFVTLLEAHGFEIRFKEGNEDEIAQIAPF